MLRINNNQITSREIEITRLLSYGKTTSQIAKELHISPHTVNSHKRNLMRKVNARNTVQMVAKVLHAIPGLLAPVGTLSTKI